MYRKVFILLFGFLILFNCKEKMEREYYLGEVQISSFNLYLTLPKGIVKNEIEDFTEGIFQQFIYSDKSLVIVSTNGWGQIELPKKEKAGLHFRKERIDGIEVAYMNVKSERKEEFDKALDFMLDKGIKKK